MLKQKNHNIIIILIALFFSQNSLSFSQIRSGIAVLKMIPGARLQSMAASHTGTFDELYSIYANPAATGFYREWQMAVSYNKWIADVYNASLMYGRKAKLPWSKNSHFALGLIYYGVPEFNSTYQNTQAVSANTIVASLNIGQPISFISPNIACGLNVKYYQGSLGQYKTSSQIYDVGILAKTATFRLGNPLLEYGIISIGCSATQLGKSIKFDMVGTPLPRSWRAGAAFYAGTYSGLQLVFSADYLQIMDEKNTFAFGAEVSWSKRFSLSGGYNSHNDLLSKISFGLTVCLDDVMTSEHSILPGRNKAIQMDIATIGGSEFFNNAYRGDLKYYPLAPEPFHLLEPSMNDTINSETVVLKWEQTRDLDLFDKVHYVVLVDQDSAKMSSLIMLYNKKETSLFWQSLQDSTFLIKTEVEQDSCLVNKLKSGDYYWSVFAVDLDQHLCFATQKDVPIAHFYVPSPDIEVKELAFEYSQWITEDDFHGDLKITIQNSGTLSAKTFKLAIYDSILGAYFKYKGPISNDEQTKNLLSEIAIDSLTPGESKLIAVPWYTPFLGAHRIEVIVDTRQNIYEADEDNNSKNQIFYTIPKGKFSAADTVAGAEVNQISVDMPLITEISFDVNSVDIKTDYIKVAGFDATLEIIAKRLKENTELKISLKGFADPNSGETNADLGKGRAVSVRHYLLQLGVRQEQIEILPGELLPLRKIPANHPDVKWILEERRYVQILADVSAQKILFEPVRHLDEELTINTIQFQTNIKSKVAISQGWVTCYHNDLSEIVPAPNSFNHYDFQRTINWNLESVDNVAEWLNKNLSIYLTITDSLGRQFRSHEKDIYLNKKIVQFERRLAIPLKFAQVDPQYDFYWSRVYENVIEMLKNPDTKIQFKGHACAVGPERINEILSKKRANKFNHDFLNMIQNQYSKNYQKVKNLLQTAEGCGESNPFYINKIDGSNVIIGDNAKPIGRKLNRRIEIVIKSNIQKNMIANFAKSKNMDKI